MHLVESAPKRVCLCLLPRLSAQFTMSRTHVNLKLFAITVVLRVQNAYNACLPGSFASRQYLHLLFGHQLDFALMTEGGN